MITIALKTLSALLILISAGMGIRQGLAMIINKPEILEMLAPLGISKPVIVIMGCVAIFGALLTLNPATFIYGNFISASVILFIIVHQLNMHHLKDAGMEIPFLMISLLLTYLHHPMAKSVQ